MYPLKRRLLLASLLALATNAQADLLQAGFRASYDAHFKGVYVGVTRRSLEPVDGQRWALRSALDPSGMARLLAGEGLAERSEFQLVDGQVRPLAYSYRRARRVDKDYDLEFDWARGRLRILPQDTVMPLAPGTQDSLSFLIAVMRKLQSGESRFAMPVAGRKRLRELRVEPQGEEILDTPIGQVRTLVLVAHDIDRAIRYELWCASDYDFLPIKLRQLREEVETIELVIRDLDAGAGKHSSRPRRPVAAGAG